MQATPRLLKAIQAGHRRRDVVDPMDLPYIAYRQTYFAVQQSINGYASGVRMIDMTCQKSD